MFRIHEISGAHLGEAGAGILPGQLWSRLVLLPDVAGRVGLLPGTRDSEDAPLLKVVLAATEEAVREVESARKRQVIG